ncbi:DUF3568 domain-containing protein [Allofrancisella guangzhouensis]|uniref:Membrane protein n=1 Tax=Allofrancisella guangzhouensis TaxID=594679 RepID=A0A0A8E2I5_9GAMM|nr:DUF3568 domain-containing protein [Allofrancisella guangzhouensis]AJC48420.1 membrane protein [Allofrancisella guangzhouensis]MBK2027313.1 DUF3568 domain-containing protein [Allofrancisella guangzhouensis]MBK2043531.1 DUF3568 domain-containing protein [Allofrancisella guangzhouensis]MBK2045463.1 DUF3568 domain-containing protein [Allofrancisella guangzhouensis]
MVYLKKSFFTLFAYIFTLTLSSCILAAVTVGGGTVAYIEGKYSMNIEGNYKDVFKAALQAVNDNHDFVLVSKDLDPDNAYAEIDGATKINSTNFYTKIEKLTNNASKVTIKFGTFGDQAMSSTLMDQIQANVNKFKA